MTNLCRYHLDWYKPNKRSIEETVKKFAEDVGKAAHQEKQKMIVAKWMPSAKPETYRNRKGHKVYNLGPQDSPIKSLWTTTKCKNEIDDQLVAVAVAVPRRNGALVSVRLVLASPEDGKLFDVPLAKAYDILGFYNRKKTKKSKAEFIESFMPRIFKQANEDATLNDASGNTPKEAVEKRGLVRKERESIRVKREMNESSKPFDIKERLAIKLLKEIGDQAIVPIRIAKDSPDAWGVRDIYGSLQDIAKLKKTRAFFSLRKQGGAKYVLRSAGRWITLTKLILDMPGQPHIPESQCKTTKVVYRPHWNYESPKCEPDLLIEADVNEWRRQDLYGRKLMYAALGWRVLCERTEFVIRQAGNFCLIDNGLGEKKIKAVIEVNGIKVKVAASSEHDAMIRTAKEDEVDKMFDEIINALSGHLRMAVSANKPVKKRRMVLE